MERKPILLRNMDPDIWVLARGQALKEGLNIGELLTKVLKTYLRRVKALPPRGK